MAGAACSSDSGSDPCRDVTCSSRGFCVTDGHSPYCSCLRGYHPRGLNCVPNDSDDPCLDVDCSGNGACRVEDGFPLCDCTTGYVTDESGLLCLERIVGPDADADADADVDVDVDGDVEAEAPDVDADDGDADLDVDGDLDADDGTDGDVDEDADMSDVTPDGSVRGVLWPTSAGGTASSSLHKLVFGFGTPQPMGEMSGTGQRGRVGPLAVPRP